MNALCNELVMSLHGSDLTEIQIVHSDNAFTVLSVPRSGSLNRFDRFSLLGLGSDTCL